ncbi:COG3650 family protein [Pedobacter arcticus]|uniref:COG3650 family protein n=1 Tax=Pedobacter arcticus TaxID=752140 RepID=UPI0003827926|nr:hypothetical protein [Pedobacter arcticus]
MFFSATGTEPFWGLEISTDQIIVNLIEDSLVVKTPKFDNTTDTKIYRVVNDTLKLEIYIKQQMCTNGMSGKVSPYTVAINFKRVLDQKERTLEGCGAYLTD